MRFWRAALACCLAALATPGCGYFGARSIAGPRERYQAAIRETRDQQMLLNLVRLQYDDLPFFLQIAQVTSQLSFSLSLGVTPRFANPNEVGIDLGGSVSETPSITYQPLQGDDFVNTLLRRIPDDAIVQLQRGNWDMRDVFKLLVHDLGRLHNLPPKAPMSPERGAEYVRFKGAVDLLHWLLEEGVVDFDLEPLPPAVAQSIRGEKDADDAGGDKAAGSDAKDDKVKNDEWGTNAVWPVLRLARPVSTMTASQRVGWCRLRRQLDAQPPDLKQPIEDPNRCDLSGEGSCPEDPSVPTPTPSGGCSANAPDTVYFLLPFHAGDRRLGQVAHITFTTRSLLEVMSAIGGGISVPEGRAHGRATAGCDDAEQRVLMMNEIFHVYCSASAPKDQAAVSTKYKRHWFYIKMDDVQSRAVFSIVQLLFQGQMRKSIRALGPTLTLPAGK